MQSCRSCVAGPQAKGLRLVELGTEQGNRALFRSDDSLDEAQLAWLREQLGDGEQLLPARFSPESLPVVVVPDREAELKQRLEDDENDKRVSMAALRLARQFTARIESRAPSRLYLNLDNPAVQALLRPARGASTGRSRSPSAALTEDHRRRAGPPAGTRERYARPGSQRRLYRYCRCPAADAALSTVPSHPAFARQEHLPHGHLELGRKTAG